MTDETGGAHGGAGPEHRLERLIFFSDAVFAIAITLLIIEIHIPQIPKTSSDVEFLNALLALFPNFVGFGVSFFVIGAFWAGHHRAFALAGHWNQKLVGPNLVLLCTVAAMPFFTAFASNYPIERVPVASYAVWLFLTGLANMRMQRVTTSVGIRGEHVTAEEVAAVRRRGLAVVLGAVTAIVIAIVFTPAAMASLMTIPFWRRLLDRLAHA